MIEGRTVTLVDTPGFDDSNRTDAQVLEEIVSWLTSSYKSRRLLSGIIYLQPITSTRMYGSAVRSLDVFSKLVGPDSFHNIVLVTTMWDLLSDLAIGQQREEQLQEQWWRYLIDRGSTTARSVGDRDSALAILKRVAFEQIMLKTAGAPLAVQKEIVDERKPLEATSAYDALKHRVDEMSLEHSRQLELIQQSNIQERAQMQAEIDKLRREKDDLKAIAAVYQQQGKDSRRVHVSKTNVYVRLNAEDFLEVDPPPPYAEPIPPRNSSLTALINELIIFSLTPITEFKRVISPTVTRLSRPRLKKDYSRIEWTCVSIAYSRASKG